MNEIWRPIPGRDGYEVSNLGRVRSIDRVVIAMRLGPRRYRARVLRPCRTRNGYCTVKVGGRSVYVHRLVLEAFVGPRPPGHTRRW
jgi:NUMOD4 motif